MPLIEYVGNSSPADNTETIDLHTAEDGTARSINRGARALVSGDELVAIAANYQVSVIDNGDESDSSAIPTEMPEGYDDNGYEEGEGATPGAVFTNESVEQAEEDGINPSTLAAQRTGTIVSPMTPVTPQAASTTSPAAPAASQSPATPASASTDSDASSPSSSDSSSASS